MKSNDIVVLKRLFSLFISYKIFLFIIFLCILGYTLIFLCLPLFTKNLVDDGILKNNLSKVVIYTFLFLIFCGLAVGLNIFKEFIRSKILVQFQQNMYIRIFNAFCNIHIDYFHSKNSTEILNDINFDLNNIKSICSDSIFFVITQLLGFIGGFIGLFIIDYRLALIVILFIPLKFILVQWFKNKRESCFINLMSFNNIFAHWFGDTLDGIKDIKIYNLHKDKVKELSSYVHDLTRTGQKLAILDCANSNLDLFLIQFMNSILYIAGSYLIFGNTLSLGSLFAFLTYTMQVINPIAAVLNVTYMLTGVLPSAHRMFEFLDYAEEHQEKSGIKVIDDIHEIKFSQVSLAFLDKPILSDVTFTVQSGDKVAIVGKNGTGKSTIINLLLKFYEPDSGHILINNHALNEIEISSYRNLFAYSAQDAHLFHVGLLSNIFLYRANPKSTYLSLLEACGLDTLHQRGNEEYGEDGRSISSGQRQKILMARALLHDKSCILLDEATSHMDYQSEISLLKRIFLQYHNKIVFLITHNSKLLQNFNKILYINDDGRIFQFNSFENFILSYPQYGQAANE